MTTADFALDTSKDHRGLDYAAWLRKANQSCGKGYAAIICDIASLSWGPGKLQPEEYFLYQLYDDRRFSTEAKRTFMGGDKHSRLLAALEMPWPEIANDKPTLTALLRGHELPIPETQAMRHRDRTFPGTQSLRHRDDVVRFLREDACYPLFTKPSASVCSLGVASLERFDSQTECLVTADGRRVPVDEFANQVEEFAEEGYLFQTRLAPHPKIVEVVGNRVSTVRMFVLVDDDGPVLLRAAWKIPAAGNVADNFWRTGNMLGGIDVDTGAVIRVLRRTQLGTEAVHEHPTTGTKFENLIFPEWDRMREIVIRAAAAAPTCHFQGWDVALTDRGPVLMELEGDGGDPIMEQLCFDTGLLEGRYLRFAEKAAERAKQRKKLAKAQRHERLRANFSQLTSQQQPQQPVAGASA